MEISYLMNRKEKKIELRRNGDYALTFEEFRKIFNESTLEQRHPNRRDVEIDVKKDLSEISEYLMDEKNGVVDIHNTSIDNGITICACAHCFKDGKEHIVALYGYQMVD